MCRTFQSSKETPRSLMESVGGCAQGLTRTLQLACGLSGAHVSHMLCLDSAVFIASAPANRSTGKKRRVCLTTGHELRVLYTASHLHHNQAEHDEEAPAALEGGGDTAPLPPLSPAERTAVLNGLPEDERAAAAAAVGKLSGTDVKVRWHRAV